MHFESTVTLGNLITLFTAFFAIWKFWAAQVAYKRDLDWRVTNLEVWRKEHIVDAESRDNIIRKMDKILYHLTRDDEPYNGEERRGKS